jgi:tetratricopeptide (TPR) repeat protein
VTAWILFGLVDRSGRLVFVVPLVTLLWANMHPGWVLAPLLLIAFAAGRLLGRWLGLAQSTETAGRELAVLVAAGLCFVTAFVNPYTSGIVDYPFRLAFATSHDIGAFVEWVSPLPRLTLSLFSFEMLHFKLLLLFVAASFALNYRRFDPGQAAVAALTLVLALTSYRHFGVFSLIAVPVTLSNLKPVWTREIVTRLGNAGLRFAHVGSVVAVILLSAYYCEEVATNRYYARRELYNMSFGIGVSSTSFPRFGAEQVSCEKPPGEMFNSYELGGFLIYRNYPAARVFIDGRLVHYPTEVYDDYVKVQSDPDYWDILARKYGITYAILIHNLPRMQQLIRYLHRHPDWQLCVLDSVACCYIKAPPQEPRILDRPGVTYPTFNKLSLARFWLNVEDYGKAAAILDDAARQQPDNGKVQLYYGRALAGIGEIARARAALEAAAQLLPDSVDAHFNLGVVCWRLGEKDLACRSWKRVLELEPRHEKAMEYLRRGEQRPK